MDEIEPTQADNTLDITADLVAAYVSNNNVPVSDLAALIASVHAALTGLNNEAMVEHAGPEKPTPAQIKKSISPDALISFEDGKSYKTLKRHLTLRKLSPHAYRVKWDLPADYPMTAANYSAHRSELARALGLGLQHRGQPSVSKSVAAPEPVDDTAPAPSKGRGRPRKVKEDA